MSATHLNTPRGPVHHAVLGDVFLLRRLGDRVVDRTRDLILILLATGLIIVGAYLSFQVPAISLGSFYVPDNPYVPLTLQTFGVLFAGAALGARRAAAASFLYLAIGAVGLPVFAAGSDGVHGAGLDTIISVGSSGIVLGVTGGYLIGFLVAGVVVGALAERGWDRRGRRAVVAIAVGTIVIYAIGVPWLAVAANLSAENALHYGLFPFLPGDLLKIVLAAGVLRLAWRAVERDGAAR